jgi:hypothetical protein
MQLLTDTCSNNATNIDSLEIFQDASFSVESLAEMILNNTYSPSSMPLKDYLAGRLLELINSEEASDIMFYLNKFSYHLDSFDGNYDPQSVAPSIIEGFKTIFQQRLLTKASGTLMNHFLGQNISAIQRPSINRFR